MSISEKEKTVSKIREFNRFYMPKLDLLNKSYLESEYSVTEARILFEIVENKECYANSLVDKLGIDKSYLSRILKRFEKEELIKRKISDNDARFYNILPTQKCEDIVYFLIKKTNENTLKLLEDISNDDCIKLSESMNMIIEILSGRKGQK